MKRRPRGTLDPLAVPPTVGQLMFDEPVGDLGDVGAQPGPVASVQALMEQSTSPAQHGRFSYSQREFSASNSAVRRSRNAVAANPHSRSEAFRRDPGASRLPHGGRLTGDIPFDLPAQRRIRVQQPGS